MPKKILYESAIHQFLWAGKRLRLRLAATSPAQASALADWLAALRFENPGPGGVLVHWTSPLAGQHLISLKNAKFYTRGDAAAHSQRQADAGLVFMDDRVMDANIVFFDGELNAMLAASQLFEPAALLAASGATSSSFWAQDSDSIPRGVTSPHPQADNERKHAEEKFHDEWAASEDVTTIDVRHRNEACTAPEMRHIRRSLGDIRGKTLLDVGCGLGEASVYFALEGAVVTATDISPGMCDLTQRLATANGVALRAHVSAIEDLGLGDQRFDIIYTGNTLHHADIPAMLDNILPHLKPDGHFACWEPLAYNPVINVYRRIAMQVRTEDEHPLKLRDIRTVTERFERVEKSWYWFTALLIFVLMVFVQFRSPNKERFWKKVVDEADRWAWLYRPLAALDRVLLAVLPFLRPLCWNVVIVAHSPKPIFRR
ncbi:MAG: bifunctional 3-demethylubiquinone-9 3-methyltransferase/2-octaprenyl-6-hydroxy phenol methylase [Verrucomicrobia bacterium]|nr:bifunctional 3-demethylubiquinone-9 3-methyltransferase/2-octaprenyl-6-hydroxy phenol methylase [Verrucomicrobiota bacterium]